MTRQFRVLPVYIDPILPLVLRADPQHILPLQHALRIVPHLCSERDLLTAERLLRFEKVFLRIGA